MIFVNTYYQRWGKKFIVLLIALLFSVGIVHAYPFIMEYDSSLHAEVIDDGPSGDEIVDVLYTNQAYLALSSQGEVYAWGNTNGVGQQGNGTLSANMNKPKKVLNADNLLEEGPYLSNVDRIFACPESGTVIAIKKNGEVYGWGRNDYNNLGISDQVNQLKPVKLNWDANIKIQDVQIALYATLILTENGEVYVSGNNSSGMLGLGSGITKTDGFVKITESSIGKMPKIKQIASMGIMVAFVGEDGMIYSTGQSCQLQGNCGSTDATKGYSFIYAPTPGNFEDLTKVENVEKIVLAGYNSPFVIQCMEDGIEKYYLSYNSSLFSSTTYGKGYYIPFENYTKFNDHTFISNVKEYPFGTSRLNVFLGKDGFMYAISGDFFYKNLSPGNSTYMTVAKIGIAPFDVNYQGVKKVEGSLTENNGLILTKNGGVYLNGKKVTFGDIIIKATKKDAFAYTSKEKYNDDVELRISVNNYTIDQMRYDELGVSSNNNVREMMTFPVPMDEKRLYKTLTFYIDGEKDTTASTFVIDLFKKTPVLSDVSNNGIYKPGKKISIGYNGFSENIISATLAKDGGETLPYTSDTEINESGSYVLHIVDQYGNENEYSFMISDQPIAQGILFTAKDPNGLIYDHAITKANAQIGTLSLQYAQGDPVFDIASISVGSELDGDRFIITDNHKLMVKDLALTAGSYQIPISGTDTNHMPFRDTITITIEKAKQSLTWDEASKALQSDGLEVGKEVTLGVSALEEPTITYSLKTENSCITYDSASGKVKASCVPNTPVVFVATSEETANYQSQAIELQVSIKKKDIALSIEIQNQEAYQNSATISIGDALPSIRVISEDASLDVATLGTPAYKFTLNGDEISDPTIQAGTYHVSAAYPLGGEADKYNITWQEASLIVKDIIIDETNADSFFTLTSNSEAYTQNTWTKDPVVITPTHNTFKLMQIGNSENKSNAPYTYEAEGTQTIDLHFYSVSGAKVSTKVVIKIDKTAPTGVTFTYAEEGTLRSFLRAITFDRYFAKAQKLSFQSSDTGSGIDHYRYELVELHEDMSEIPSSKQNGTLNEDNTLQLLINKSYRISAWAVDHVGNESSEKIERVYLSDAQAQLLLTATSGGALYDESSWVKQAIQVKLSTTSIAGAQAYSYSLDGESFIELAGDEVTLPDPLTNQNNTVVTFRALHQDGTKSEQTLHLKVDTTKPQFSVQGKVNDQPYDGGIAQSDITLVPSQEVQNMSGVTYYYTTDITKKDHEPTAENGWNAYSGTLRHTTNGTSTYYFKAVSGAGIVSDVEEITVSLAKKNYTPIQVNVTSDGMSYTAGTWTNHDLTFTLSKGIENESLITGYEAAITDGTAPTASTIWESVNEATHTLTTNQKDKTIWFRVLPLDPNGSTSSPISINLDVDTPSVPVITMEEIHTSLFAECINFLSMGNWMNKEMRVRMHAQDSTSGVQAYEIEVNENGNTTTQTSEDGILTFGNETNITLKARACDVAGNCSAFSEQAAVHIDMDKPVITGVKDASVYHQYYLPRVFEVADELSGLKTVTYQFNQQEPIDITNATEKTKVSAEGDYRIQAFDMAGNEIVLTFRIVPLPDITTNIDGTDESKQIIEQIKQEYEEVKADIDPTETSEFDEWIKDAEAAWKEKRLTIVETEDKTSRIEATGNVSFDPTIRLYVEAFEESELPYLPKKTLGQYHVYLKKGEDRIQPEGAVDVYLPYIEEEAPIVYQIDAQGKATLITSTKAGSFVKFTTSTLYDYAITNHAQEDNKRKVCVAGPDGIEDTADDVCGTENEQGEEAVKQPDGSVEVPSGGSVIFPDGSIVEAPDGAIIYPDGSVEFPDGSKYDPDGTIQDEEILPEDMAGYFRIKQGTLGENDWYTSDIILEPTGKNGFDLIGATAEQFQNELVLQTEGEYEVSFYLKKSSNSVKSSALSYRVKIDHTNPILTDFVYQPEPELRALARTLTFDHFFQEEKQLSFTGSDDGSGIAHYRYEIVELNPDGSEEEATKQTGTLYTDSVSLAMYHQYRIRAWAVDQAGNESEEQIQAVYISDEIGELSITATSNGASYDASRWSASPITFQLESTNASGVEKYQYSLDGGSFVDMSSDTITLPDPVADINNVPITFRAVHQDGTSCDKVMYAKVDTTKPEIEIAAMVEDEPYDGGLVDQDITITARQTNTNLSQVTYYYTTEESIKNSAPSLENGWSIYREPLIHQTNGSYTYYLKAVSEAGLISDTKSVSIQLAKKVYTPIQITATSEQRTYAGGSWVKHDVSFTFAGGIQEESAIEGYEYAFTDGSEPTSTTKWEPVTGASLTLEESIEAQTIWVRVLPLDPNHSITKGIKVMLDVDAPSIPSMSIQEHNTSAFARLLNSISFGTWMSKEAEVTLRSQDAMSGIAYYEYEEASTSDTKTIKQTTDGSLIYKDGSELRLRARACDRAGNCSSFNESEEILIDMQAPIITGVKDQGVYKQYYLPRFVKVSDAGSGIKSASYTSSYGASITMQENKEIRMEKEGSYHITAIDQAGNQTQLSFTIARLPDIDTEIDGSDESKAIIDQIQKEFEENKDKFDATESKEYNKWIEEATKKWQMQRIPRIEDDETGTIVEGQGTTTFDPKTELVVEKVHEEITKLPRRAIAVYDVYLKKGNTIIQPDGSIKVSLPYTDTNTPIVYEIDEDGNVKEIACVQVDGYVSFITDQLKRYAISNTAQEIITPPDEKPDTPTCKLEGKEINMDTDGDELPDVNVDFDLTKQPATGDCVADLNIDTNLDNIPDIDIDSTGDGKPNINVDVTKDGKADINIVLQLKWKPNVTYTVNGFSYNSMKDLEPDLNVDIDGDGSPDRNIDEDNDGLPDTNVDADWFEKHNIKKPNTTTSVQGSYQTNIGGAATGDKTKWLVWLAMMVLTIATMAYKYKKMKAST